MPEIDLLEHTNQQLKQSLEEIRAEHTVLQDMLRQAVEDNSFLYTTMQTFRSLCSHFAKSLGKVKKEARMAEAVQADQISRWSQRARDGELEIIRLN